MHIYDAAHLLLETHHEECTALMREFIVNLQTGVGEWLPMLQILASYRLTRFDLPTIPGILYVTIWHTRQDETGHR
jgi:hypothetical protein